MATTGLTYDEVMARTAQQPRQGLVLDEHFDVVHEDDDKSEEEDFEETVKANWDARFRALDGKRKQK